MALNREAIVSAGIAILDDYGLADVSMRRVADALGVQAGALYYHVPNKQSLLAAVADEILGRVELPQDPRASVAEWLTGWADGLRAALLAHRDAAELVASTHALGLGDVDPCSPGRERLREAGLPRPAATMAALLHFVLGHVTEEQTTAQMVALGVMDGAAPVGGERDFAWGIGLLIRGIETPAA